MADQVRRRQEKEDSRGGLVITKAEYGHYVSSSKKADTSIREPQVADVTIPVAALVDHGQLIISKKTAKVCFHLLFHLMLCEPY
jgi:DnaJ family protein C protein 11